MKLKNDKERDDFLRNYTNEDNGWYLWQENSHTERRWWRRDIGEVSLIAEEWFITRTWPQTHSLWELLRYFAIDDWDRPFADGARSKTQMMELLKNMTMSGKEI